MSEIYASIGINMIINVLIIISCLLLLSTLIRSFKIRRINNRMMKITGMMVTEQDLSVHP